MDEFAPASVRVTPTTTDDALILTVHGAIDASTRGEADNLLRAITGELPPPDLVVVDLTALGFTASAGIRLLAHFGDYCRTHGISVRLVAGTGTITHRLIRVAGLDKLMPVFAELADALDGG